ncbi:MAG: hypothetical protein MdMp024_0331 [Bacteroidales bacterium]|jgi:hypothetical protein
MLDFISVPLIVGICVAGVYGLFELFARKKERLAVIEKIGEKIDANAFDGKLVLPNFGPKFSFSALKVGSLLMGIGLGLLVGFLIHYRLILEGTFMRGEEWRYNDLTATAYGAAVLLFGGAGLVIAFLIEARMAKKNPPASL